MATDPVLATNPTCNLKLPYEQLRFLSDLLGPANLQPELPKCSQLNPRQSTLSYHRNNFQPKQDVR
ncbi:Hypothetical predicted protein [Pelobates cultripes]|uniref:Uncharacterized protein n=1 Tax=Pelobates cultripes TaxID=61616 RepID=A0AAD1TR46_PELCU|nr:Hypothetical predicted protein [Pelobates cultripes]